MVDTVTADVLLDTSSADVAQESTSQPKSYGDDYGFDRLWDGCEAGHMEDCDELQREAREGTEYFAFGYSCGARSTSEEWCVDQPLPPGSDADRGAVLEDNNDRPAPSPTPNTGIGAGGGSRYGIDRDLDNDGYNDQGDYAVDRDLDNDGYNDQGDYAVDRDLDNDGYNDCCGP